MQSVTSPWLNWRTLSFFFFFYLIVFEHYSEWVCLGLATAFMVYMMRPKTRLLSWRWVGFVKNPIESIKGLVFCFFVPFSTFRNPLKRISHFILSSGLYDIFGCPNFWSGIGLLHIQLGGFSCALKDVLLYIFHSNIFTTENIYAGTSRFIIWSQGSSKGSTGWRHGCWLRRIFKLPSVVAVIFVTSKRIYCFGDLVMLVPVQGCLYCRAHHTTMTDVQCRPIIIDTHAIYGSLSSLINMHLSASNKSSLSMAQALFSTGYLVSII